MQSGPIDAERLPRKDPLMGAKYPTNVVHTKGYCAGTAAQPWALIA